MIGLYAQDCSELSHAGAGRVWLCRLLRPTLGKKILLVFVVLAATGVANWLAVGATLLKMQGMTALVNVSGSVRWLSQGIQLDVARFGQGFTQDRTVADARVVRLEAAISALETGGVAQGIEVKGLPDSLRMDIAALRLAGDNLRRKVWLALDGLEQGRDVGEHMNAMHAEGANVLGTADAIAAALTLEAQDAESHFMGILLRLGLLDLTILAAVLLIIRRRVVHPLRKLATVSRDFSAGNRALRSGFRSYDEIGQLAAAFDTLADTIERDMEVLATDAIELEKRQQALAKFSLAVEQSPVTVLITDADGTIEYVNPKFTEITGYAPEEAVGRNPRILQSGQMSREVFTGMWQQLRSGKEWHGELLNMGKTGDLFWEDTRIAPLKDEQGRITHFVAIKQDITARKQAEAAMTDRNAELERRVAERTRRLTESNRELEAFSYSVSHDLRAPLRGINGFASLMAENCQGCDKTESIEYMARIRQASVRMGSLIDDMLDLARVARSEIKVERLDLGAMAHSILDELAVAAPQRQVERVVQECLAACGDPVLMRAVLENLLGNAWKFTAGKEPARIHFASREENGERVYILRDNGAGFDMKYAGKLFGAFQRLHAPLAFEGNGIGLAMVRRIIGQHGGRIWAEGVPDGGATFYFTLGVAPENEVSN